MSKIIIHNDSGLPDSEVVDLVRQVIDHGKVSGPEAHRQYAYGTRFTLGEGNVQKPYMIWASLHRKTGTHVFRVWPDSQ